MPERLIERLRSTAEKCRNDAATASDPEVAQTLLELAEEMEALLPKSVAGVRQAAEASL